MPQSKIKSQAQNALSQDFSNQNSSEIMETLNQELSDSKSLKPLSNELLEVLKKIPSVSGVYHYFDEKGRLLYIGKAKNLKNRIRSYFRLTPILAPAPKLSLRITQMVNKIAKVHYIVVENENDALILENSLIKQLKPKYNVLLRDDKTYPYLYVDFSQDFPRINLTRKVLKKSSQIRYFGPYSSGVKELLESLYEFFPLVQKESCLKGKKVCLFYQIKRCLGVCEGKITPKEYEKILKNALDCLENPKKLLPPLEQKMLHFSQNLQFEKAALLRDRIQKIKNLHSISLVDFARLEDLDIFALEVLDKKAVLVKFFMRKGKIISSDSQIIRSEIGFDKAEIYKHALVNYYSKSLPLKPKQILIPFNFGEELTELEDFIKTQLGKKIPINFPKSGDKKSLCDLALQNAKEILKLDLTKEEETLKAIKNTFDLENTPFRIEVFDTSHHQGKECVGSMIVYEEGFVKESYRHYLLQGRDEYTQMREMLSRRIEDFKEYSPPDLWLLDGGSGQINLACNLLESAGINLDVLGIAKEKVDFKAYRAKGKAKDIVRDKTREFRLNPDDKRLQFLQKLRDEAHRFAITFHQKQKQKTMHQTQLLAIKGIAKATQKRLLDYFGSFEAIKNATKEDLQKVVSENIALKILSLKG